LLLGCVQREFFSQVNAATARVLAAKAAKSLRRRSNLAAVRF